MMNMFRNLFKPSLQLSNLDVSENKRIIKEALRSLNCTGDWQKDGNDIIVRFDFQSGHFGIFISAQHPQIELSFLYFGEAKMEEINLIRHVCNHFNINSDGPRFAYSVNEETNVIDLHIMTTLLLDQYRAKDILSLAMQNCFAWQNAFIRNFNEVRSDARNIGTADVERTLKDAGRELFLLREMELMNQETVPGWRHDEATAATLSQWMVRAFGMADAVFSELTIVTDKVMCLDDSTAIANYNLSDALIADNSFVRQKAMLDLVFFLPSHPTKRRRMMFSLQQADSCENILYYQVVATLLPLNISADISFHSQETEVQSRSVLLAYDLRSAKQFHDEFVYMWKEAKSKMANGEQKQLTDEQLLIANIVNINTAEYIYRGKVLYRQKRYYEAVVYLENVYKRLQLDFHKLKKRERETFFDVSFWVGFCYNALHQYERAHYYLAYCAQSNSIEQIETYVNCLVNMGDFRTFMQIGEQINRYVEIENDYEEGENPIPQSFLNFLQRRKVYMLIKTMQLDEAEDHLHNMLHTPENKEFALSQLAHIQQLREKQKEKEKGRAGENTPKIE